MSKIQIICTQPGIRRNGVKHPASAVYDDDHWTEDQLKAFRADRAFVVQEVSGDGIKLSGGDISAEVDRRLALKINELQAGFDKAVSDAVDEKLATSKANADNTIDDLGRKLADATEKLATASATIIDLQAKLDAATQSQGDAAGKATPKK